MVLNAEKDFDLLIKSDFFITKKDLDSYRAKWFSITPLFDEFKIKNSWNITIEKTISYLQIIFQDGNRILETRNNEFIRKEQEKYKDFFDHFGDFPLSGEQRRAIITDEYAELVVAGAGSGKTTTIAGKVAYLNRKGVKPEEILCLSYGVDVKDKIKELIGEEYSENVRTIHSLGNKIVKESTGEIRLTSKLAYDETELRKKISDFLIQRKKDKNFQEKIKDYFLEELRVNYKSVFDFKYLGEYYEYLRKCEIRSLNGDKVRSFEECEIANFLYLNGIDYEYEAAYEDTANVKYQYQPDFFLTKYKIFIEHFGVDKNFNPAPIFENPEKYKKYMEEKRERHKKNGTTLIETYSFQKRDGTLTR